MTSTPTRADRRRATEARILDGARRLFAAKGFDRTTIRAVASSAQVDPALVMQYFGSKRELFAKAVETSAELPEALDAEALSDQLLAVLGLKLDGLPDSTLATLRSMLTDPNAADHARQTLGRQIDSISAHFPADDEDAELRAALLVSTVVGVAIGHQLLGIPPLRDAPAERIASLFRPALMALADPPRPTR